MGHEVLLCPLEYVRNNPVNDQAAGEIQADPADEQGHDDLHDLLLLGLCIRSRYLRTGHLVLDEISRNCRQYRHDICGVRLAQAGKP